MKLIQKTITTIVAEDGMILRRKSDGWIAGSSVTLGYNYYDAGITMAEPVLETPDDYEEIEIREDYQVKPIIDQSKRLDRIKQLLEAEKQEFNNRGLSVEDMINHRSFAPVWGVDIKEGSFVEKGLKFTYDGELYSVLQNHTVLSGYYPCVNTASLYVKVTPDFTESGDEYGTLENPIPYESNMILEINKYYTQYDVVYLCGRDSINPVYHDLKDLVGLYVELV